jgi:acetyl esterase/lipase
MRNNTCSGHWAGGAVVLLIAAATLAQTNRPDLAKLTVLRDIEYVPGGHERQKLDLYLPKAGEGQTVANAKRPLIVWVHGGAWLEGNKNGCPAVRFTKDGYAVASINYRLSQHAIFPAQIQDCKAAIRWLRANADKHGIDPNRIGVWGASAGGHLVALLGTTGDVNAFDVGPNAGVSSRVQAVCDFFGPTDFTKMSEFPGMENHDAPDSPESKLVGGAVQENKDKVQRANPITYVTKDDPPFMIVHGDKDPTVPYNQSELLRDALVKAGVSVTLYTVQGGGHGPFRDSPVDVLVTQFFDKHLRKPLP